jgi:hypothetical protein
VLILLTAPALLDAPFAAFEASAALPAAAAAAVWLLLAGPSATLSGVTSRATVCPRRGLTATSTMMGSSIMANGIFS